MIYDYEDIGAVFGVEGETVRKWRQRYGDFPRPDDVKGGVPIWFDLEPIRRWYRVRDWRHRGPARV